MPLQRRLSERIGLTGFDSVAAQVDAVLGAGSAADALGSLFGGKK